MAGLSRDEAKGASLCEQDPPEAVRHAYAVVDPVPQTSKTAQVSRSALGFIVVDEPLEEAVDHFAKNATSAALKSGIVIEVIRFNSGMLESTFIVEVFDDVPERVHYALSNGWPPRTRRLAPPASHPPPRIA